MQVSDFLRQGIEWRKQKYRDDQDMSLWLRRLVSKPVTIVSILAKIISSTWQKSSKERLKNMAALVFVSAILIYIFVNLAAVALTVFFMAFDSVIFGQLLVPVAKHESSWQVIVKMVIAHPIIPMIGDVGVLLNLLIYYCLIVWITSLLFDVFQWLKGTNAIVAKYSESDFHFSDDEYDQAAEALKQWTTCRYEKAVQKYGERPTDLLFLAEAIFQDKYHRWSRGVAIKAIEEDREARDDEE